MCERLREGQGSPCPENFPGDPVLWCYSCRAAEGETEAALRAFDRWLDSPAGQQYLEEQAAEYLWLTQFEGPLPPTEKYRPSAN